MTAFANHFAFEFKAAVRSPNLLMMHYLFPLAFYAAMGLVMTQINPAFVNTMLPAMVIFAILAAGLSMVVTSPGMALAREKLARPQPA